MQPGETGLEQVCDIQAESITTIRRVTLGRPRKPTRKLDETQIRAIATCVVKALGVVPADLAD
jgi:mRNA-degrading endonuclease toxin of MazEF toxin-antitoxin module